MIELAIGSQILKRPLPNGRCAKGWDNPLAQRFILKRIFSEAWEVINKLFKFFNKSVNLLLHKDASANCHPAFRFEKYRITQTLSAVFLQFIIENGVGAVIS